MPFVVRYVGPEDSVTTDEPRLGNATWLRGVPVAVRGSVGQRLIHDHGFERVLVDDPSFADAVDHGDLGVVVDG